MKAPQRKEPLPGPPSRGNHSSRIDEEIDKQEQSIIASMEIKQRKHKRYMETQEKMRSFEMRSFENFELPFFTLK